MNSVVVSAFKAGYTVRVDGKTVDSKYLKQRSTLTVREMTSRALEKALQSAKTHTDHGKLVIEVSDTFLHANLQDDRTTPTASAEEVYRLLRLIQDCDATVKIVKVKQTHAQRYVKVVKTEPAELKTTSLLSAFSDID